MKSIFAVKGIGAMVHGDWATQWIQRLTAAGVPHAEQEFTDLETWSHNRSELEAALQRRLKREPFAYIVGTQPYYHRLFTVNQSVLIPRPETEYLVEMVLPWLRQHPTGTIVDCGTGSGAIAITVSCEIPTLHVIGIDNSPDAIKLARLNAQRLHATIQWMKNDLLQGVQNRHIDAIIANLPYLPQSWKKNVQPELSFEPPAALYSGADGLDTIRRFIDEFSDRTDKPRLWLELLPQQIPTVTELLQTQCGGIVEVIQDRSGTARFIQWHNIV